MKGTISDVRQLFNVKAFAFNTTVDNLAEGQTGVFPVDSDTSVTAANMTFANLPDSFRIISKIGGKVYFTQDNIEKAYIKNAVAKDYQAEVAESWTVTPENCECITSAQVRINIDTDSLLRRDGLTWTNTDFVVAVAPKELECLCNSGNPSETYNNNIFVKLLSEAVNATDSPYYYAEVTDDTGAVVADVDAFIAANETVNTDDDETNDGGLLNLVIKGKLQPASAYKDLDVNHIYPRGVRLTPVLVMNEEDGLEFTQTTELVYERGAGADLRSEEFENMSNYTTLNHYPRLSDGIASPDLVYQFENGVNYNTVVFEYSTDKVERTGDGDRKGFVVTMASSDATVTGQIKAMLGL